jgi:hypothetical protein
MGIVRGCACQGGSGHVCTLHYEYELHGNSAEAILLDSTEYKSSEKQRGSGWPWRRGRWLLGKNWRSSDHRVAGGVLIQPLFGLNRIDLYMRGFALFLLQASCLCSLLFGSSFLFSFIVHSLILGLLPIKPLKNHYKTVQFISFISGVRHHIL